MLQNKNFLQKLNWGNTLSFCMINIHESQNVGDTAYHNGTNKLASDGLRFAFVKDVFLSLFLCFWNFPAFSCNCEANRLLCIEFIFRCFRLITLVTCVKFLKDGSQVTIDEKSYHKMMIILKKSTLIRSGYIDIQWLETIVYLGSS